jgi:Bacterial Ig-like domain
MMLNKLKMAVTVLMTVAVVGVGAGSLLYQAQAAGDAKNQDALRKNMQEGGTPRQNRSADAVQNIHPLLGDDLRGNWTGERDGVKVKLTFNDLQAKWPAHWQVEYKRQRPPENSSQSPTIEVNKEADLKVAADATYPGRWNLYVAIRRGIFGFLPIAKVGYVEKKADKETLQLRVIPTGRENVADHDYDYPAVEGLILHREGKSSENDRRTAVRAGEDITIEAVPPVVVKTVPQAGMTNVDAKTKEIQVTFSKEMTDESWSWSQLSDDSFPKIIGKPKYLKDKRTCVAAVKLEPGKTYAIWLNSEKFHGFQDADGRWRRHRRRPTGRSGGSGGPWRERLRWSIVCMTAPRRWQRPLTGSRRCRDRWI